jgi:hypothetical protein
MRRLELAPIFARLRSLRPVAEAARTIAAGRSIATAHGVCDPLPALAAPPLAAGTSPR